MQEATQRQKTPFTVEDLFLHKKVVGIACSPDGKLAVCEVRSVDRDSNTYISCLWQYALDGTEVRQLTFGPGLDSSPSWSPQGSALAFLSNRGGSNEIFLLPLVGGEARPLASLPGAVQGFQWTPDGRNLIATVVVGVNPDDRGHSCSSSPVVRKANDPEVAWKLPYKADGVGYLLGRQIHLFKIDTVSGESKQLTLGDFDVLSFGISSDSRQVAYARTRAGRFAHASDLWKCAEDGSAHEQLTHTHAMVINPSWAPNGESIAFTGAVMDGDAELRPWVLKLDHSDPHQLCDEDVALAGSLKWLDNERMIFVRAREGRHSVVYCDVQGGKLSPSLIQDWQFAAFDHTSTHLAFSVDHPSQPSELHVSSAQGEGVRCISGLNGWWADRITIELKSRQFEVPDGLGGCETIHGWLMRAKNSSKGGPLLSDVHGGPASFALLDFDTNVYWQVLCSRGWSVLALNAVGSSSFGREFCRRLSGHWGTYDFPQHLAAIDQLQEEGVCDERIAIAGKSYGGYLTSWAVGHTERFKAAVVMAPVGNIETHYGTSDGGYYADPYNLGSAPRFDAERARELSPMQFIERSTTATLFMQGKEDERCPKCQSEELFVRMSCASEAPAELVLYPNEGHGFLGSGAPECRADAAKRIVAWLEKYVQ